MTSVKHYKVRLQLNTVGRLYQWRGQELGLHIPNPHAKNILNAFHQRHMYAGNMQAVSFSRDTALNSKFRGIFDLSS